MHSTLANCISYAGRSDGLPAIAINNIIHHCRIIVGYQPATFLYIAPKKLLILVVFLHLRCIFFNLKCHEISLRQPRANQLIFAVGSSQTYPPVSYLLTPYTDHENFIKKIEENERKKKLSCILNLSF